MFPASVMYFEKELRHLFVSVEAFGEFEHGFNVLRRRSLICSFRWMNIAAVTASRPVKAAESQFMDECYSRAIGGWTVVWLALLVLMMMVVR